jgi:mono/diheme cytochrome c family protein
MKYSILFLFILMIHSVSAADVKQARARQNYMVHCQGCHLPDASGSPGRVPNMKDFIGNFLRVPGGREFIIRVPGAASALISDEELAELMNWLLETFSKEQLPADFKPYTAAEAGTLRKHPLIKNPLVDGIPTRKELTTRLAEQFGIIE